MPRQDHRSVQESRLTGTVDTLPDSAPKGKGYHIGDGRKRTAETRFPVYALRSEEWRALFAIGHKVEQERDEQGRLGKAKRGASTTGDEPGGSPLAAHVLLLLWAHAATDKRTGVTSAWVSLRRLADLTTSYKKSIYDAITRLRRDGWIGAIESRKLPSGKRGADRYTLTLPGAAGEAHAQMLARLGSKDGPAVTSPLVIDGDCYHHNGAWHIREARIPLPVMGSVALTQLRRASPLALHLYCLLVAYAPGAEEYLGGTRLAAEARMHKARVTEAIGTLSDLGWLEKRARFSGRQRLADSFLLREIDSVQAVSPERGVSIAPEIEAAPVPEPVAPAEVFGEGRPPEDLLAELDEKGVETSWADDGDLWDLIKSLGLWPRPMPAAPLTAEQQAVDLVVQFHVQTGAHGADYVPTRRETVLAEDVIAAYGGRMPTGIPAYIGLLRHILGKLKRAKFVPQDFGGARRYLPGAAAALRLDVAAARRMAAG